MHTIRHEQTIFLKGKHDYVYKYVVAYAFVGRACSKFLKIIEGHHHLLVEELGTRSLQNSLVLGIVTANVVYITIPVQIKLCSRMKKMSDRLKTNEK